MNSEMNSLAAAVIKRLFDAEFVVLTEADIREHIPIILTRASGNMVAKFLAELKLNAGVQMFINPATSKMEMIRVLVARTLEIYMRERVVLEQEFIARFQEQGHEVSLIRQTNIYEA